MVRCPPPAAFEHVSLFQGQPWECAHCRISRRPEPAASLHVVSSQGQSLACAHFKMRRLPPATAASTLRQGLFHRAPSGSCRAVLGRRP
ncbi:unnamed protein product [Laminaria digitata]